MLAQTLASWGKTLQASEPDCMVKATVVRSMAPACAESFGMTALRRGENSQKLQNKKRIPNGA